MNRRFIFVGTLASIALLLVFTRCGINSSTSTATSGTFTAIWQNTLSTECQQCHQPGGSAFTAGATVDFTSQTTAYNTLTAGTVQATDRKTAGTCQGVALVTAGQPSQSYLEPMVDSSYQTSNFAGKSGCTPSTTHSTNLSSSELSSITAWINAGALNN